MSVKRKGSRYVDLDEIESGKIRSFHIIEEEKTIPKYVEVKQEVKIPEIKFIPKEVLDVTVRHEELVVKDVKVQEEVKNVTQYVLNEIKKDYELPVPKIDEGKIKEELKNVLVNILNDIDIKSMVQTAVKNATRDITVNNAVVKDVLVQNAIIEDKRVTNAVIVDEKVSRPVYQDQIIRAKKIILDSGVEL
jgi:hypothetical protein